MSQITGQRKHRKAKQAPSPAAASKGPNAAAGGVAATAAAPPPPPRGGVQAPIVHQTAFPETPVGMPVSTSVATAPPIVMPEPAAPFTPEGLLAALQQHPQRAGAGAAAAAAGGDGGVAAAPVYTPMPTPKGVTAGHIPMIPAPVAAAASVPMAALGASGDGSGAAHLRHVLDTFGFAIVTDVLSPDELVAVERAWADDLRSILVPEQSPNKALLDRLMADPVHEWPMDKLSLGSKFASDFGLPQGRAAWQCRSHPNVRDVFATIFNGAPVCCGMDNVFFDNAASAAGANAAATSRLWPHADQNIGITPSGKYECYQGVLYVWPANADTSATVVWPGSHTSVYPHLVNGRRFRRHFCMMDNKEYADFARNAGRVPVPAGGLLLWNSRTIHQGWPGGARLAFPICYEPTSRRDHKALATKQQVILDGNPTTHWASLGEAHHIASGDQGRVVADGVAIQHVAHRHAVTPDGLRVKPEFVAYL